MRDTITAIQVCGWQSWLDAYTEFLPGINILHGHSDQGKSAFMRLLRWALMNDTRMSVDRFRNWKLKKNASVYCDVQFGSDEWVSREQSRTVNQYRVYNIEDALETIRSSVPKEVGDIIRMNSINFQEQKTWFMLDKKPGQIAKEFNKLTNLGVLDAAISESNSRIRTLNTELKRLSKDGEELNKKIERNTGILQIAEKEFDVILQLNTSIQKDSEKCNRVFRILQNINEVQEIIRSYEPVTVALRAALNIKDLDIEIDSLIDDSDKVSLLIADIKETQSIMKELKEVSTALEDASKIQNLDTEIIKLSTDFHQILDLVKMIENQYKVVAQAKNDFAICKKQKHDKLEKLGYCPLCQRGFK